MYSVTIELQLEGPKKLRHALEAVADDADNRIDSLIEGKFNVVAYQTKKQHGHQASVVWEEL